MKLALRFFVFFLIFFAGIILNSCSYLKAKEAPDSGFLEHSELMKEDRTRAPFNKVWRKNKFSDQDKSFEKILIRPVDTTHMLAMAWTDELSLEGKEQASQDAEYIAKYLREEFKKTINADEDCPLKVTDRVEAKTIVLEMALVELVPTKAWLNIAGNVTGSFVPGASLIAGLGLSGSIAIEGRLKDGETGEVVAMFKDHEKDQSSPLGIQDFTWYQHSKDAIDDWADQFVKLINTDPSHKVEDSLPLTLKFW